MWSLFARRDTHVTLSYEAIAGLSGETQGWCARSPDQMAQVLQYEAGFAPEGKALIIESHRGLFARGEMFAMLRHMYADGNKLEVPFLAADSDGALYWGLLSDAMPLKKEDLPRFVVTEPGDLRKIPLFTLVARSVPKECEHIVVCTGFNVPSASDVWATRDDDLVFQLFLQRPKTNRACPNPYGYRQQVPH